MSLLQNIIPALSKNNEACACENDSAQQVVQPVYSLQENADAWMLTVQLPGVNKAGLEITAEEGLLVIKARRTWKVPAGWTSLHRESADTACELIFRHDNTVDVEKIHAELNDGILLLSIPKAETIKPRKIQVT